MVNKSDSVRHETSALLFNSLQTWWSVLLALDLLSRARSLGTTCIFFFSSRRRHTRFDCDWSSDVCSSDLRRIIRRMVSAPSKAKENRAKKSPFGFIDTSGVQSARRVQRAKTMAGVLGRTARSEERRVGKECRSRWWPYH